LIEMIFLTRNDEWISIAPSELDDGNVHWLYGEGKVGKSYIAAPEKVMSTQIAAHVSKGWELAFSLQTPNK